MRFIAKKYRHPAGIIFQKISEKHKKRLFRAVLFLNFLYVMQIVLGCSGWSKANSHQEGTDVRQEQNNQPPVLR